MAGRALPGWSWKLAEESISSYSFTNSALFMLDVHGVSYLSINYGELFTFPRSIASGSADQMDQNWQRLDR